MKRLEGKAALITGGASGIGKASAELMANEGAYVMIADYNQHGAVQAANEISRNGHSAKGMFLDAGDPSSIKEAVDQTYQAFGKIDILFNNVGVTDLNKDLDVINLDLEEWDRLMAVNTKSVLLGARYAIPYMTQSGGGSIINNASMAAFSGDATRSGYGASKAAVENLTRNIAVQYGKDKIRANAVAPGLIMTPAAERNMPEDLQDLFLKYNSLPYHGDPEDIGHAVVFLASDESKFMTGQTLEIEGGHYIANPSIADLKNYMNQ